MQHLENTDPDLREYARIVEPFVDYPESSFSASQLGNISGQESERDLSGRHQVSSPTYVPHETLTNGSNRSSDGETLHNHFGQYFLGTSFPPAFSKPCFGAWPGTSATKRAHADAFVFAMA